MMSERLSTALIKVPATKPNWTAIEIQLTWDSVRCHSFVREGTTAEPLNHSDMPKSSASARSVSARHLRGTGTATPFSIVDFAVIIADLRSQISDLKQFCNADLPFEI